MSQFRHTAYVTALVDGNATVVAIELVERSKDGKETIATVTGSSMRAPGDKHDEEIAVTLAMGRAFEKLGRRLTRRGNGLVRAADNIAAAKLARKYGNRRYALGTALNLSTTPYQEN